MGRFIGVIVKGDTRSLVRVTRGVPYISVPCLGVPKMRSTILGGGYP